MSLLEQGISIPDIDLIVIYGIPNTIGQFYQVNKALCWLQYKSLCIVCVNSFVDEVGAVVVQLEPT